MSCREPLPSSRSRLIQSLLRLAGLSVLFMWFGVTRVAATPAWIAANTAYYQALTQTPDTVAPFLHPDFVYLTAYRTSLSKEDLLHYLARHQDLVQSVVLDNTRSWRVGDMALVTGFATTQGNSAQFTAVRSEYWHIWWFRDGAWTLRVRQASLNQKVLPELQ